MFNKKPIENQQEPQTIEPFQETEEMKQEMKPVRPIEPVNQNPQKVDTQITQATLIGENLYQYVVLSDEKLKVGSCEIKNK